MRRTERLCRALSYRAGSWRAVAVLIVGAVLGALAAAAPAGAAEDWDDSETQFSLIQNCLTRDVEAGVGTYVSILRDRAALPKAGTVYYARTVASVIGNNCPGHAVRFEVTPPPGTSVAISASTPVRCFVRNIPTGVTEPIAASRCPQTTSAAIYGGSVAFDPADAGGDATWTISDRTAIEIQFPLVSTTPLVGNLVTPCDCLRAFTKVIDTWDNPVLLPFIEVAVGAADPAATPVPPAGGAPAPALTGSTSQKLGKTVAVSVACPAEACRATAGGSVRVPKRGAVKAKTYRLQPITKQIAKDENVTIKPWLTRSARSAIKKALKSGKKVVVKLTVLVAGAAGTSQTLTRDVRLRL